ncbi:hypothetical protein [Prauserella endophytica]|uniref:Uncharacterized protein n=1 Tax=Prauserella endophytica TaxID=1592324 RepID=A0ABY2RSU1_9PSEU|nr:hypothetical protein [Prauserella endophytica]TKG58897.1 hypothetical protein FCN18_37425 [Prauserella endophytica]
MQTVRLYHPNLDRWCEFPESSVPQHQKAGWLRDVPARRAPVEVEATADPGGEETKPRRRRTNTEES